MPQFFFKTNEQSVSNVDQASHIDITREPGQMFLFIDQLETISGIVKSADGQLLEDITVMAWSEILKTGNTAFSKADGTYEIKGLKYSNDYCVRAIPPESSPFIIQKNNDIFTNSQDVDFVLSTGYTLKGRIMDSTQIPLTGIFIEIYSKSLNINKQARSNYEGNYAINGLPEGNDYLLRLTIFEPKTRHFSRIK